MTPVGSLSRCSGEPAAHSRLGGWVPLSCSARYEKGPSLYCSPAENSLHGGRGGGAGVEGQAERV